MQVVLYQPRIPQNAGNVVRTCAVTGCSLVMVRPLGFSTHDRWLKRAGLDYWEGVDVSFIDDLISYIEQCPHPVFFFSSHATRPYTPLPYTKDSVLVFGSETAGLPEEVKERWPEQMVSLPMREGSRCLNLATSVGIGVYEAWRHLQFQPL